MQNKTIVILTGAGVSAESGLATFRASDGQGNTGLWCNHRIEDVATPEGFARDPALVHAFYNQRRAQLKEVAPNAAHDALARLCARWPGRVLLVTQNVDDLHDRAAEKHPARHGAALLHMHGELRKARCAASDEVMAWDDDITPATPCPCCGKPGRLRPHIVWFGEMPLEMGLIHHMLIECDLFLSIGTSGNVYPAAGFVQDARRNGRAHTVELNLEPSGGHSLFHEKIYGPATQTVPAFVEKLLADN
jgi:NAD-dependent deacetylase